MRPVRAAALQRRSLDPAERNGGAKRGDFAVLDSLEQRDVAFALETLGDVSLGCAV